MTVPHGAYQPSGIAWLGDVPAHWIVTRLKHCVEAVASGGTPDTDNGAFWAPNGESSIPWVSIGDMTSSTAVTTTEKCITSAGLAAKRLDVFPPGTLLYSMYASLGKVAVLGIPAAVNQAILGIIPDRSRVDQEFLRHWLVHIERHLQLFSNSNTQENLNAAKVRSLPVLLPPLNEQSLICGFLNAQTQRIDQLIAEQHRLVDLLNEKRQAVISRAVTKGLNPDAPMKDSGVEWLGDVPAHWKIVQLKHLARSGEKSFTDGDWIEAEYISDEGIRLLQTGNIGVGAYKEQGYRFVSEDTFQQLRCTEIDPGDVLICRLDGPVGRACIAPDLGLRMITSVDNAILKVNDSVDARFVVALLSSAQWISWIESICRVGGGFRLRVSRNQLGEQRIPVPPTEEQIRIAEHLQSEMTSIDTLVEEARRAIGLLQERRTALISAAVTGQIDVRALAEVEVA